MCTSTIVLVCSGRYNKNTIYWWLINKGNLSVIVLEAGNSKIKALEDFLSGESPLSAL